MKSEEASTETQMVIPNGYKLTELGEIPEDWQCVRLGEIGQCIIGLTYSPRNVSDSGVLVLRSSNVRNGKLAYQDNVFVNMELPERVIVKEGDILICVRNGSRQLIGKCALIDQKAEGFAFGAFMSIYRTSAHDYIFYQFQSDLIQNQINETMGATINQITNKDLSGFKIPIPICVKEQKAIANVLSDTDALLTGLEQLITKKQAIKTATMQQLLTGRIRLTQFAKHPDGTIKGYKSSDLGHIPEDWEEREIGQFAPLQRGFDLPASKRSEGLYPVVYSNGIVNTHNHFQVKGPGVVTGRSGTLGKVHHIECDFWPHNTSLWVTKFINSDSKFVYYIFKYIGFERFASGSGVPTLNRNDAHSFKVAIPSSLKEQTAIATVLSDMDAELVTLEKKLAKVRDIKQGMMQQLLTGRIRLSLDHQP
ncbi:restriction endonuclease subunit S [Pantoea agglomerans]|uniref:restriction endonuclease subunit S n=1 Tax=Enterobacter agglomerans TaxID=549 RepID=UPI001FCE67F1|nr:restriction endonuclease subunit S [Pantoea agglomerans]